MEYLSAIAGVVILLVVGCGTVGVAYLAWDDIRSFRFPSLSLSVSSLTEKLKSVPVNFVVMAAAVVAAAAVVYLVISSGGFSGDQSSAAPLAPQAEAVAAPAPAVSTAKAPVGAIRTVTSTSCAADGCPAACATDEVLTTAYCISGKTARLTDTLQVKAGVVTAKCGPTAGSIVVSCAHK